MPRLFKYIGNVTICKQFLCLAVSISIYFIWNE